MSFAALDSFRNLKIKTKLGIIFILLFLLLVDLGALNVSSVIDIQADTQRIADELIPRLIQTTTIKDNLNLSILAAYDYVENGNKVSKKQYEEKLEQALVAQIELFYLSSSEADFEFTTSFQNHINNIHATLKDLIETYETGGTDDDVRARLLTVSKNRDSFALFLEEEIENKIQQESLEERTLTAQQVRRTIVNVFIVGAVAVFFFILLYVFLDRSITVPVRMLTEAAVDLGHGNFKYVDYDSGDELGLFAETFNTMSQKIKATQESLQIELEKTKKLDKQKTEFLSIAAHQLRTPMSGIKWVVNMAVTGDLGKIADEAKEQLGKGLQNIDRMIALINSLLDVTQIETEQFEFKMEPHDIVEIMEEVYADLEHAAQEMGVAIIIEQPKHKLEPVIADAEKLKMALRNVIDNGIKYTPKKGSVTISFEKENNDTMLIHIADTGYGIPKAEQDRIYTKFFRGSNVQTIQADGSGLGLFIVHEIIRKHDGDITFESEIDKGTTFTIELPIADKAFIQRVQKKENKKLRSPSRT